jgi:NDP-sugar pyrophosphorylase family protein/mannose-6-phosphate isomerase-like protein (cupin superfamily)
MLDFPEGNILENNYINKKKIVEKPWGREIWLELNDKYCYKRIEIKAGFKTSYQLHNFKSETNYLIQGNAEVWLENDDGLVEKFYMSAGDFFNVIPKRKHRVIAITDIILQEVSTPEVDDVIRLNDEFNRGDGKVLEEHFNPVVCIIAAGIGSRFGEMGKNCHKALLPFKHKAILTHIIEKFKPDTEIVIAVGYLKEQIIEYVQCYHSKRDIKFVNVENYESSGSGPAHSLECCRSFLQKPFYFCVSDFYTDVFLQNDLLNKENWIGVHETTKPENYSTFEIKNGIIEKLVNKSSDGFSNAFTGVFYMYDYSLFWNSFDKYVDEKKEVVDIFKDIKSFNFKQKQFSWIDVGTLDLYNNFIDNHEGKNLYLHNTKCEHKYKKEEVFIKKLDSQSKITNVVERAKFLKKYTPKILHSGKYYLSYEYAPGQTLYSANNKEKYLEFFSWFESNFCNKESADLLYDYVSKNAFDFYKNKTYKRLELLKKMERFESLDNITQINGVQVLPIEKYLDLIDWENISTIIKTPLFHGDLQFDNIVAQLNGNFKLIDWREDFGGEVTYGDLYYDLAKLNGGMELNYLEMKNPESYSTIISDSSCEISEYKDPILKDIQKNEFIHFLNKNNFDKKRVKLLTAIIFLNMAPLHINEFDLFLFMKSKKLFSELL